MDSGASQDDDNLDRGLDALDLEIVSRLQVDGRATFRSIAESIGTSETTVRNRMRRLFDDDVVQVVTVVRPMTTQTTMIAMFLMSVGGDPQAVADEIVAWPEVTFVALTGGAADLLFEVVAPDRARMYALWRRLHTLSDVTNIEMHTYLKVAKQLYTGPKFSS